MTANELVWTNVAGRSFTCTRRTEAHLKWTIERLAKFHPGARLVLIQTCYNTSVEASAGTHDYDAVFDVQIIGLSWPNAQRFLRSHGWAAWTREPPTFGWHIHMLSIPPNGRTFPQRVGIYVPGQLADYRKRRSGLSGHSSDPTWHPADIDSTIFDYPAWLAATEDDMPYTEKELLAIVQKAVAAELDRAIDTDKGKRSIRQQVKEVFHAIKGES